MYLYSVPHFFFIGFHKLYNTRECNIYIVLKSFCKSIKVTRMEKICFTFLVITCVWCMQIRYSWFYPEFHFFGPRAIFQQTDLQYKVFKWGVICSHDSSNKIIRPPSAWIFRTNIFALLSTKRQSFLKLNVWQMDWRVFFQLNCASFPSCPCICFLTYLSISCWEV